MQAGNPVEPTSQPGPETSLTDLLHEAPVLLERLCSTTFKNLSATCKSLRTVFCARVSVITLSKPADARKVRCNRWPQLMMVVCTCELEVCNPDAYSRSLSALPGKWEHMMEVQVTWGWGTKVTAVLVRPWRQKYAPLMNLSSQHCAALSGFADKYRNDADTMTLRGPLVTCTAVQSLTHGKWPSVTRLSVSSASQLGAESVSCLSCSLPSLTMIEIVFTSHEALALFQKESSWSQMRSISFSGKHVDANAITVVRHANWTNVHRLSEPADLLELLDNIGIRHLVPCSCWCVRWAT